MSKSPLETLLDAHSRNGGVIIDFHSDYNRFRSVNTLLLRFRKHGFTNSKLLLNHCTILFTRFNMATYVGFELEINPDRYELLVSTLIYMQRITTDSEHDVNFLKYLEKEND